MDSIISALGDWLQTSEKLLQELEDKVTYAAQKSAEAQAQKQAFEAKIEEEKNLYKARTLPLPDALIGRRVMIWTALNDLLVHRGPLNE